MSKRVLVTGCASGIGRGIVENYLEKDCKVIMLDKDEEQLSLVVSELDDGEGRVQSVVCDLENVESIRKAASWAYNLWKGLDILVNNAGLAVRESFIDIGLENWNQIMNVNLNGTFILSQIISKRMKQDNISGSIVNMSSKNGLSGSSKLAHYNASKAGINLLTQSMAVELAPYRIRVNAVAPGFIDTPLDQKLKKEDTNLNLTNRTPMQRLGTVKEVANGVYFLTSDQASYITGTILVIDGGHMANGSEL